MNFKFTTIFSSVIKPLVSEEKDKYLALASLIDVGNFVPDVDTEKNIDLLPIAFNACVINRVNKNGDVIDTATAADIYKNFINKPINIEHNRERVIGVILAASFSEFGSDLPLTEEQVKDIKGPFNITLGGVVWKVVNSRLAQMIEDSNDPTSEDYQKISASWELGFSDYVIAAINGDSKNLEDAEIISDSAQIDSLSECLRSLGGTGKTKDGRSVYRKVTAQVVPLGVGLTENPAADVKGVAVKIEIKESNSSEILESISHLEENNVNISTINKDMKITKIEDINDESMKQLSASSVTDFISEEMKKASEQFSVERNQKDNAIKNALEAQVKLEGELATIKSALADLEAARASKEAEEAFNARMSSFDAEYDLDDEDRSLIATDVKDLSEEGFAAYTKKMSVLMKAKKKMSKEEFLQKFVKKDKKEDKKEGKEETKASEVTVEEILEKAEVKLEAVIITSAAADASVFEKYKKAFSLEQFEIKN